MMIAVVGVRPFKYESEANRICVHSVMQKRIPAHNSAIVRSVIVVYSPNLTFVQSIVGLVQR